MMSDVKKDEANPVRLMKALETFFVVFVFRTEKRKRLRFANISSTKNCVDIMRRPWDSGQGICGRGLRL